MPIQIMYQLWGRPYKGAEFIGNNDTLTNSIAHIQTLNFIH